MDDLENELEPRDKEIPCDSDSSHDNATERKRKAKLPLAKPVNAETPNANGFHQSTRICLELIREAMLHHRWQEAAEYMAFYPQRLEDTVIGTAQQYKETVWRLSTEILHHLPNSKLADYNNIYERMKQSGVRHYLTICLEQSFHLMLHGHIEDAKRQLSAGESWRHGKESVAQHQKVKLIQVYRDLLHYIHWCEKKSTGSSNDCDRDSSQTVHTYSWQASVNVKQILKNPGVWDPFILSYVEILEFNEDHDQALEVLNEYAHDNNFPPNPNAHMYLYQYLKRHNAPEKKLIKVLKVLHAFVPSHELMLEYTSLLLNSEKHNGAEKALEVVLEMLEFACWRRNLDVWELLKTVIQQLQKKADWEAVVLEKMDQRKDWWPAIHFTSSHARKDSEENPELFEVKSSLTGVLLPDCTLMYGTEQRTGGKVPQTSTSEVTKESLHVARKVKTPKKKSR